MLQQKKKPLSGFTYYDLAAIMLGIALFVFFAVTAKNGVSAPDESFYFTVTQRLALGEKLIADEWNIAQLVHLLNVLPYFVYTRIAGGTEGIILFMRYLFIAVDAIFYAYVYCRLRRYRLWGVAAALSFCGVILQTIFSITYFTAAPMAVLAFCLILLTTEGEVKRPRLLFCGVLLACAILAEPYLIAGFGVWFVTVTVRQILQKKQRSLLPAYGFLLDARVFYHVTLGAVAVFIPFMAYMIIGGSFAQFPRAFPYLASGAELGLLGSVLFRKSMDAARFFGFPFVICGLLTLAGAAAYKFKKKKDPRFKRILFLCAAAALAGGYICAGIRALGTKEMSVWVAFAEYHDFSFLLFSPVPFLLSEKKNPRLAAFWATGAAFGFLVDASSAVILGAGGGLLRTACLLKLAEFLPELREEQKQKNAKNSDILKKGTAVLLAVCAAAAIAWHGGYALCETVYKPVEKLFQHVPGPLTAEIEKGPFKGLKTTPEIADVYLRTLADLDRIKETANGRPVAVLDLAPYTYLYMDLPYGTYTAWFEYYETERLSAFWTLRPERQPVCIYLPFYDKGLLEPYSDEIMQLKLDLLQPYAEGEIITGAAGYIINVTELHPMEIE